MASPGEGTLDVSKTDACALATGSGDPEGTLVFVADLRAGRGAASLGSKALRDTTASAPAGCPVAIVDGVRVAATASGPNDKAADWGGSTVRDRIPSTSPANDAYPTISKFRGSAASPTADVLEAASRCVVLSCSAPASLSGVKVRVALLLSVFAGTASDTIVRGLEMLTIPGNHGLDTVSPMFCADRNASLKLSSPPAEAEMAA
jgi:hypothetical protein